MKNRKHCTRRMWWWWIKKKVSWLYSTRFFLRVLFIKILNIITLFILFFIIIILFFFYYLSFIYYNYYSTTAIPSLIIGIAKYKYNSKKVKSLHTTEELTADWWFLSWWCAGAQVVSYWEGEILDTYFSEKWSKKSKNNKQNKTKIHGDTLKLHVTTLKVQRETWSNKQIDGATNKQIDRATKNKSILEENLFVIKYEDHEMRIIVV